MEKSTILTSASPELLVDQVSGELQIKGWDRQEVFARAATDNLEIHEENDTIHLQCKESCQLRVPFHTSILINEVRGNVGLKFLHDQISIQQIHGCLSMRGVNNLEIETIHGDMHAKMVEGNLKADNITGNVSIQQMDGDCTCKSVSGNLVIRDLGGEIQASALGNVRIDLSAATGNDCRIMSGGNLHARLPEYIDASVSLTSDSGQIKLRTDQGIKNIQNNSYKITTGSGETTISLSAGGALHFSCCVPDTRQTSSIKFDEFDVTPEDFSQQIADQVDTQIKSQIADVTDQIDQQISQISKFADQAGLSQDQTEKIIKNARGASEKATTKAAAKIERSQRKLERKLAAAQRKADKKIRSKGRYSQTADKKSWKFEWSSKDQKPPVDEPVSDEERLMILRMLADNTITLEQADQLLSALEGENE